MNVILLHLDEACRDQMAAELRDDGHHVRAVSEETGSSDAPDVLVVCLDVQAQRTLDLAARVGADCGVQAASILFVGGSPAALSEAQRRFPKASFARSDSLSTALASMQESGK
jgi:hypothetical protein